MVNLTSSDVHCIVPARMGSSRLFGKPLLPLCGVPMIVRTLQRARAASCFARIVCATDSPEIAQVAESAGFEALVTPAFATGSDRVGYVARTLNMPLVVNLQGDEPIVGLEVLRLVAAALRAEPTSWVTAAASLDPADVANGNVVKVLIENGYALDFCRLLAGPAPGWFRHRGIYAYSLESMLEFDALPRSASEIERSLEQMRVMGKRPIRVVNDSAVSVSVDVSADVAVVESLIKEMHL
jgi:3-deoxy-manno-octulosonate cytidylyltransferase (CMP-KDO synthetase)